MKLPLPISHAFVGDVRESPSSQRETHSPFSGAPPKSGGRDEPEACRLLVGSFLPEESALKGPGNAKLALTPSSSLSSFCPFPPSSPLEESLHRQSAGVGGKASFLQKDG